MNTRNTQLLEVMISVVLFLEVIIDEVRCYLSFVSKKSEW